MNRPKIKRRRNIVLWLTLGLGVLLLAGLGFYMLASWLDSQKDIAAIESTNEPADIVRVEKDDKQHLEGKSEAAVSKNTLESYKVPAKQPRALYVDKLGIAARILPMGVNADGSMQAPLGIYDAGWYTGSASPTQVGALAIDGHASGPTKIGLFARLDELVNGDVVKVETGDGKVYLYEVVHKEDIGRGEVDMKEFLSTYGDNPRGLNLITCGGEWERDAQTFSNRIVVYTKLVKS